MSVTGAVPSLSGEPRPIESPWLSEREAAEYLRVSVRSLQRLRRAGEIDGYPLFGSGRSRRPTGWRYRKQDLDRFLLRRGKPYCGPGLC